MVNKVAFQTIPRSTQALKEAGHGGTEMRLRETIARSTQALKEAGHGLANKRLGSRILTAPSFAQAGSSHAPNITPVQRRIADMVAPTSSLIKVGNVREAGSRVVNGRVVEKTPRTPSLIHSDIAKSQCEYMSRRQSCLIP